MTTAIQEKISQKISGVLIVDDQPIVRKGLTQLINQATDLFVCGEADSAHQALEAIKALHPKIAVVDVSLNGISSIELIKDIKVLFPSLLIAVFSLRCDSLYAERAFRAGARGYIQQDTAENVLKAIRRVLNGEIFVSESLSEKLLGKYLGNRSDIIHSPIERLSDRELEVFELVGRGFSTRQIADKIHLSIKTIETYQMHIKKKLNLKNARELLMHAIQWIQGENQPE